MELHIKNRKGKVFIVKYDAVDFDLISKYTWHISRDIEGYCRTCINLENGKKKYILMHRLLLGLDSYKIDNTIVDHINRNPLDNRRENIRKCNATENSLNRTPTGKSKYLGVCKSTGRNKWQATIKISGKYKMLGRFDTEIEAAKKYNEYAKIHHKEFANLNAL